MRKLATTVPLFLVIALIPAYAEELWLPDEPYDSKFPFASIFTEGWTFNWVFNYKFPVPLEPDQIPIGLQPKEGETPAGFLIRLSEQIDILMNPPQEEPETEVPPEILATRIEEKKAELEAYREEITSKLRDCKAKVTRWSPIQEEGYIEGLEIPIRFFDIDEYSSFKSRIEAVANLELAACNGMLAFEYQLAQYESYKPDPEPVFIPQEPAKELTTSQRAAILWQVEADQWAHWKCKDTNLHLRLCPEHYEFIGEPRTAQPPGLECQTKGQPAELGTIQEQRCPLAEMAAQKASTPSTAELWENIREAMCDIYYPAYKHLEETPTWLVHCKQ